MTIPQLPKEAEQEYYKLLAKIESNNNPNAKAQTSSASGLYQPIKATWESYGYNWKDVFSVKLQNEFIERFTADNANILIKAGCAVNFATLYGAHFLGPAGILKVMRGVADGPITSVTSAAQRKANPSILSSEVAGRARTIRDFTDWLKRKTGDDYTKRYTAAAEAPKPVPQPTPIPAEPVSTKKGGIGGLVFVIFLAVAAAAVYFIFFHK